MPAKSSPMDKTRMTIIKKCADVFAPPLTRLVTLSFNEGKFPHTYKQAHVTPLLIEKSLDADVIGYYRPICILNTISKIVERVHMTRLATHVKHSPNNYNRFQSTHTRGHSTETAILRMLNGARTMLLQLDLSSAFDTVDIITLLQRLRFTFGISGLSLNWVSSY
jgi:Reverse transcriptase (RNA-dependent DNA polymerase)